MEEDRIDVFGQPMFEQLDCEDYDFCDDDEEWNILGYAESM